MAYQVAASIGSCATALCGKVDAIILSGGVAKSNYFVSLVKERCAFIAPVEQNLSEVEMSALAEGGERALLQPSSVKHYPDVV
jgi:butyrate kinase